MLAGLDKFNGTYIKLFGDIAKTPFTIALDYARVQKISDDYYWLLGYATFVSNVEFRYKPEKNRFPDFMALLLKKKAYSISLKNGESWEKLTFEPSKIETALIDYFHENQELFLTEGKFFKGNIALNDALYASFQDIEGDKHNIANMGILNLIETEGKYDLPDCEFKESKESGKSTKSSSNYNSSKYGKNSRTDDPVMIPSELAYLYYEASCLADKAYEEFSTKYPDKVGNYDIQIMRQFALQHVAERRS
jgi:hypothetical protein